MTQRRTSRADIVREQGPFSGVNHVHGVTYDGERVWLAAGGTLNAVDPATGTIVRSIEVAADAGTAFDGRHLFQLAEDRIQKSDGGDQFFCGGGRSGRLRTVRRRRRDD